MTPPWDAVVPFSFRYSGVNENCTDGRGLVDTLPVIWNVLSPSSLVRTVVLPFQRVFDPVRFRIELT